MKFCITWCAAILAAASFAKCWALAFGSPILNVVHKVFGVRYAALILGALLLEMVLFAVWLKFGSLGFLKACAVFGGCCLLYHAGMSLGGHLSPCPCLGGLFHGNKVYGHFEQMAIQVMSTLLFFLGLFGFRKSQFPIVNVESAK